ncbi:hypothetical protein CSAL01_00605 [Colletotrichum salicis]|uniref:Uncharacterized protein n=1 Tax=Colletotrichum salicis TaxID=1209931 RepID=A0A135U220_9PEZI|nr:hypothetical protein CSAL01_00605 [Colletotrichum salicis]
MPTFGASLGRFLEPLTSRKLSGVRRSQGTFRFPQPNNPGVNPGVQSPEGRPKFCGPVPPYPNVSPKGHLGSRWDLIAAHAAPPHRPPSESYYSSTNTTLRKLAGRLDRLLVPGSPLVGVCTPISFPPTALSPPDLISASDWRAPIPSSCAYTCCCTSDRAAIQAVCPAVSALAPNTTIHDRSYAKAPSHTASNLATFLEIRRWFPLSDSCQCQDIPGEAEQMMVGWVRPPDPAEDVSALVVSPSAAGDPRALAVSGTACH